MASRVGLPTTTVSRSLIARAVPIARRATRSVAMAAAATASPSTTKDYDEVCKKLKELSALSGISGLLEWDQLVMMPPRATDSRGAQKAALAGVLHDKRTEAALGELLDRLRAPPAASGLGPVQAAVVREAWRDYRKATAIPKDLAQRIARLETESYTAWVKARKASDFSQFAPYLQQWVDISRQKAALIDPSRDAYDVLLDDYEKGMTSGRLDQVFAQVVADLRPLVAKVRAAAAAGRGPSDAWLKGDYDVDAQAALCRSVALDLGFNLDAGRLDVSVHPFTGGAHPTDVRMTTRFKPDDVMEGLTGAIHETGHALYEQGRQLGELDGLPVNAALSMGIHESQSLLWERMVALSRPFATYLLPKLRQAFPGSPLAGCDSAELLYASQNVMRSPSLIRTEADELTYPMHVILRYEIERGLISGSISVADVPSVWNAKMVEYLGCAPPSDDQGCLQDVHWSAGALGYFPTYTLGAMAAAQIFAAAQKQIPGLEDKIAAGEFGPLKAWLNEHVHRHGSLHANADELMTAATGSPLDPSIFMAYLTKKYTELYKL